MLSILCEALDCQGKMVNGPSYSSPLLRGLSRVFLSTQRRHFEQIKVAIPVIIKVLKDTLSESEGELEDFFDRPITIAESIHGVCIKLEGRGNERLCSLLGLYVLQILVFLSLSIKYELAGYIPLVERLARFLPYCGLSYLGLITGSDVEAITNIVAEGCTDNEYYYMNCLSDVKLGASLAVIWGKVSDEIPQAAQADLTVVEGELQTNQIKRWEAVGMLKQILSSANLPWELRTHAIDFLLCITSGNILLKCSNEIIDCSIYTPSLFAALQAITVVIIYAPDTAVRKKAFDALKRILADIPTLQRFDVLKALVRNCESSSMIAILLDLVRNEMHNGSSQRALVQKDENPETRNCACTSMHVLELVVSVLRPSKGGPPSLPEEGDAVLASINLSYLFWLPMTVLLRSTAFSYFHMDLPICFLDFILDPMHFRFTFLNVMTVRTINAFRPKRHAWSKKKK
ncbi:aberrant root formation protein 4 [Carica papaya]|uniref:aberrant root formation protein 4 n=1 Tax=Carica papaya TaxID=3649 RepID=UPI000B8D15AB|nr:aberrant root formation protein 4 [Carica papaya]